MHTPVRSVAMMLQALLLASCSSLHTIPGPPRDVVQQIGPRNVVRLTDKRGAEVTLADVHVEGDSLVGVRSMTSRERIALLAADVDAIALREFDPVKTVFFLALAAAATVLMLFTLFSVTGGFKEP